jgi:pyruvyltransferase
VESILEASLVISATIEGIAVAEAYGTPARHLDLQSGSSILLDDYVQGTGRPRQESARSIEHALDMGGMPTPHADLRAMIDVFPIDLWRDGRGAMHECAAS